MYGLIVKVMVLPGRSEQFIALLRESAADMPGCLSYVVSRDTSDEDTIWVTEVWNNEHSHQASLSLPRVQDVIPRAKAIVTSFERVAVTEPVWGAGVKDDTSSP